MFRDNKERCEMLAEYVIENGGKLYYVERAKELLAELNETAEYNNTIGDKQNERENAQRIRSPYS